jgi:hypothetical protein
MKKQENVQGACLGLSVRRLFLALVVVCMASSAEAKGWRFAVIGDHRGDNKAVDTNTFDRYTDGGINQPVLIELAKAIKAEDVEFVLEIGDLVTKYTPPLVNINSNALLATELATWRTLWNKYSGKTRLYPVRGNQEVTASAEVWKDWTDKMPGIGSLPLNGPPGEQGLSYAFKHENCLFVGLDQYASPNAAGDVHIITPQAMKWLNKVLTESDKPFKFVYGHVPPFETWDSKSANFKAVKDGLASPTGKFKTDFMAMRDTFWSVLGLTGAEYFCGHEHIFSRALALDGVGNWVPQTIIGTGGAPPPPIFPAAYTNGPFAESYTNLAFPTYHSPPLPPYLLELPRVASLSLPVFSVPQPAPAPPLLTFGFGYAVFEVDHNKVTVRYMAEPTQGAGFQLVETWTINKCQDQDDD